jgi:hypothetical protein
LNSSDARFFGAGESFGKTEIRTGDFLVRNASRASQMLALRTGGKDAGGKGVALKSAVKVQQGSF